MKPALLSVKSALLALSWGRIRVWVAKLELAGYGMYSGG
jgi:hypothetical protein